MYAIKGELMKKSAIIKIVSVVCILVVIAMALFMCIFFANTKIKCKGGLDINKRNNTLISKNNEIKILQISDTQFASIEEAPKALDIMQQAVDKSNPDMIVLTGDNINDNSKAETVEYLVEFMDSFQLPWALVFGNHDYNASVSAKDLSSLYEDSKYCIYSNGLIENSYGNYSYTIKRKNKSIYSLIFMDSGKTGFTEKHVEWYEGEINKTTLKVQYKDTARALFSKELKDLNPYELNAVIANVVKIHSFIKTFFNYLFLYYICNNCI